MYCAITATVFIGGAGVAIIGGLYWKRGTTQAAWAAMITGMVLSLFGIVIKNNQMFSSYFKVFDETVIYSALQYLRSFTGQEMTFAAITISVTVYILVSLFGPRTDFNMDKLLHRGKYAVAGEKSVSFKDARTIMERLGFSREFTGRDKWVAYITLSWPLIWTAIFIVGTIYNITHDVSWKSWLGFWKFYTYFTFAAFVIVMVWFAVGGFKDIRYMFNQLRTRKENTFDDGRVIDGHNAGEEIEQ